MAPAEAAPKQEEDPLQHTASIAEPLQLGPPGQEGTQMAGEKLEMAWGFLCSGWDFPPALAAVPRWL